MNCPPGKTIRKAYTAKLAGKTVRVGKSCVGYRVRSKSKVRIGPLQRGTLTTEGYHSVAPTEVRHEALSTAVEKYGPTPIFRKLNAVATLNKRSNPTKSKTFRRDRNWVKKLFMSN